MAYFGCGSSINKKRWNRFACFVFMATILLVIGALTVSYGGRENNITGGVFLGLSAIAFVIAAVPVVLMAVRPQRPELEPAVLKHQENGTVNGAVV